MNVLFNYCFNENILLTGYYIIHKNTIITIKINEKKERILGFGSKEIMNIAHQNRFIYQRFLESDYMKNKKSYKAINISITGNEFYIYIIRENIVLKQNIRKIKSCLSKQFTSLKESTITKRKTKKSILVENIVQNILRDNMNYYEQENTENENIDNSQKNKHLIEYGNSQSSALTKSTLNSVWNINKTQSKDNQNNFTSKKFLKSQILLGIFLIILLFLMIILFGEIRRKQKIIAIDCNNYLDLIQFIRIFQQYSAQFLTIACFVIKDNDCKSYISKMDTDDFNQTLFFMKQNEILAEYASHIINKIIINSELIKDQILLNLLRGNFSYYLVNKIKKENKYIITNNIINLSLNEALLLTINNMRIISSLESRARKRNKDHIYLLSGLNNPFENLNNLTTDLSEYQIAVYTYLMNYRGIVFRFNTLNQRFHTLIIKRNNELLNIVFILHDIIFLVKICQILIILFYLYTYNRVLAEIINSIIDKFDIVFDDELDFKKIFTHKINLLESLINEKNYNPGNTIHRINKNCNNYENLVRIKKKMEQNLNINKKFDNEEDKSLEYKDNQKFINWIDIYKKGYNKPYIIFIIIIVIIDYVVFGFLYGLWKRYESQSILTFDLIHDSWDFERLTLTIINYYHHMIFMNQTLDDISNNYFHENNNSCIENFLIILTKYNKLRKKIDNTDIIKSYNELCEYNCQSLYDFIGNISNSWIDNLKIIEIQYGKDINIQKNNFIQQCENSKTFVVNSVTT